MTIEQQGGGILCYRSAGSSEWIVVAQQANCLSEPERSKSCYRARAWSAGSTGAGCGDRTGVRNDRGRMQ